jgi:predicted nuclease of predicted toxin-antitoxin system
MPQIVYDTKEAIPEPIRSFEVQEKDGKFVVDVSETKKVAEFRDNNIRLNQTLEKTMERFKPLAEAVGVDPKALIEKDEVFTTAKTKIGEMVDLSRKMQGKKFVDESGLDTAVAERTKEMVKTHETQMADLARKMQEKDRIIENSSNQIANMTIRGELRQAFDQSDVGFRAEAFEDVLSRAGGTFRYKEGKIVAMDGSGATLYGENAEPMTMKEWLTKLAVNAPHFLKSSKGGNAEGGGGGNNSTPDISKMSFAEAEAAVKAGKMGSLKVR